ncbi:MAG: FkbM family methyltransferase [bacterium]
MQMPYDKFLLFEHYVHYLMHYFFTFEFIRSSASHEPLQTTLFQYKLFFVNYGSMFVIFNEIFGQEVYKFSPDTQEPFIIDCGSNIGLAIFYFKVCYPKARILGFEASPETFAILQQNVTENKWNDVTVYNQALHNKEDKITFYSCKENAAIGGWSVMGSTMNQSYEEHSQQVQAMPLSPYIDRPVDLIKMDIEGAEDLVLEELAQSGKLKLVKYMILEYHHHMVDVNQDCLSKVLRIFEDNGFGVSI